MIIPCKIHTRCTFKHEDYLCQITIESTKGTKHTKKRRPANYLAMEKKFITEHQEIWQKGNKVMGWWFKLRSKQLLNTLSPGEYLKLSAGWCIKEVT